MEQQNKRRNVRRPADAPVFVRWRGILGEPHVERGRVLDFSETGLRVEIAEPIDAASLVVAGMPGQNRHACVGRVRYCLPKQTKYIVGLQLNPNSYELHSAPEVS